MGKFNQRQVAIVRSLVDIYRHEGWLPDARSGNYNGRTAKVYEDVGLFTADQLKNTVEEAPLLGIPQPARGLRLMSEQGTGSRAKSYISSRSRLVFPQ